MTATTWNPSDKSSNMGLSNGNLTVVPTTSSDGGVRAVNGKNSGKWYFEITCTGSAGGDSGLGVCLATANLSSGLGSSGYKANIAFNSGAVYLNGASQGTFGSGLNGLRVDVAVDFTNKKVWFRKSDTGNWNNASSATQDPASNLGGFDLSTFWGGGNQLLYPCMCANSTSVNYTANFGATSFAGTAPSGFSGWDTSTPSAFSPKVVMVANGGSKSGLRAGNSEAATAWFLGDMPQFSNGSASSWSDIAYSPSLDRYVAIANGGDNNKNNVAISDDHGSTFIGQTVPNTNTWTMNGICWSEDKALFVIVASAGPTTTTRILTSPDGVTWTARTIPDASIALWDVEWSPELGIFCAVGASNKIYTSTDGTTWTAQTGPATSKTWLRIVWAGDGVGGGMQKFCVIAQSGGGSNDFMYSTNGTAWTQQNLTGSAFAWADIGYSIDRDQLIVVGGNTGVTARSTNATSWTQQSTGLGSSAFQGVAWSADLQLWVMCSAGPGVYTSPDGIGTNWTSQTAPTGNWNKLAIPPASGAGGSSSDAALSSELAREEASSSDVLLHEENSSDKLLHDAASSSDHILAEEKSSDDAASSDRDHGLCIWSPTDKDAGVALSNGNLTATLNGSVTQQGVRGTVGHSHGKFYFEINQTYTNGLFYNFGMIRGDQALSPYNEQATEPFFNPGLSGGGGGQGSIGKFAFKIDIDGGTWSVRQLPGGGWIDNTLNSGAGEYFPFFQGGTGTQAATPDSLTANFGASSFEGAMPFGYKPWDLNYAEEASSNNPGDEAFSSDKAIADAISSDEAASSDYHHNVTWNPNDKSSDVTLSNGNLTAASSGTSGGNYQGVRATLPHSSGRYYYEIHIDEINQANQFQLFGIGPITMAFSDFLGPYENGTGGGAFIQFGLHDGGGHFTMSDIYCGIAVDFNSRRIMFKIKVGSYTSGWMTGGRFASGNQFPMMLLDNSGIVGQPTITANFGQQEFIFGIPANYVSWDSNQFGSAESAESIFKGSLVAAAGFIGNATNGLAYSPDATTWTQTATVLPAHDNGSEVPFTALAYSPRLGRWVAIAPSPPDTARQIVTSDDDGKTWTSRTSPEANSWESVCWSPELHLFVAVSSDGTHRVMTSPDGITWTVRDASDANQWWSVAWSPELGLFAAVAKSGVGTRAMTSPDGITWTTRTSGHDSAWNTVVWAAGLGEDASSANSGTFVAIANSAGGANDLMYSRDGVTWTAVSTGSAYDWVHLCWSPDLQMLAACGDTGGGAVLRSTDMFNWTVSNPSGSNSWKSICWSRIGQCFVIVQEDDIRTSPDAVTWTAQTTPGTNYIWESVAEGLHYLESPSSELASEILLQEESSDKAIFDQASSSDHLLAEEKSSDDAASSERLREEASSDKFAHDAASSDAAASSQHELDEQASSSDVLLREFQSSDKAEADAESSDEAASSDLKELLSDEQASSELQSELTHEVPPPIQVVGIVS